MKKLLVVLALLFGFALVADAQVRCGPSGNVPLCLGNNVISLESIDIAVAQGRPKLSATLNVYIDPASSYDPPVSPTAECLISQPCKFIRRGFLEAAKYDLGGNAVIINLANGTYDYTTRITEGPTGSGQVIVTGPISGGDLAVCTNRDLVLIRPPAGEGHGFGIAIPNVSVTLQCMNIETALGSIASYGFTFHTGVTGYWRNITFGAAESGHVSCNDFARCEAIGDYSISGSAPFHVAVGNEALAYILSRTITFETSGSPYAFSTGFAWVERGGGLSMTANNFAAESAATSTVTISAASPGVVTWIGHGLAANTPVAFTTSPSGALPNGLSIGTVYYVRNVLSVDTFTVSATVGGVEINTTGASVGTLTGTQKPAVTGRQCFAQSNAWITPGFLPTQFPSVAAVLPGSLPCATDNGGIVAVSGGANIGPFSTMSGSGTLNIGFQPNLEIHITGTGTISSFGAQIDSTIGMYRFLSFEGNYTILNNSPLAGSYILTPDGRPMYTQAGSRVFTVFVGANVWRAYWEIPNEGVSYPSKNLIVNPSFDVWQAGTSFAVNPSTYLADRWKGYRGAAGMTVSRSVAPAGSSAEFGIQIQRDSGNGATTGMYLIQQLENDIAYKLRSKYVVLSCEYETGANWSDTAVLNIAYRTGTGTSEEFNPATLAFTTGNVASGNVENTGILIAGASGKLVTLPYLIPSNVTQAAFIIQRAPIGTAGADDWIRLSNCNLNIGRAIAPFIPTPKAETLAETQRRYRKSFLEATAPAQNVGAGTGEARFPATTAGAAASFVGTVMWGQQMALTMAGSVPSCTLYNPAATNAQVRNITDGADLTASVAGNVSQMGFSITATGTAGTAVGETLGVHWTCDSRM